MRKMTEDMFDQVIAVHLRGTRLGTGAAANVMRDQQNGGSIVNISSISGKVGLTCRAIGRYTVRRQRLFPAREISPANV
jgi:NAD(P)-dependent dehydrogenase (short-subunit alcohol dehydrogenase family)